MYANYKQKGQGTMFYKIEETNRELCGVNHFLKIFDFECEFLPQFNFGRDVFPSQYKKLLTKDSITKY